MCEERDTRDYAIGSYLFVAVPRSRSGEHRRQQRTAWLEPYAYLGLAVRTYYRSEHKLRRCPNLRGPTGMRRGVERSGGSSGS